MAYNKSQREELTPELFQKIKDECYALKLRGATFKDLQSHIKRTYNIERDISAIHHWMKETADRRSVEEGIHNLTVQQMKSLDQIELAYTLILRDLTRGYLEIDMPEEKNPSVKRKSYKAIDPMSKAKYFDALTNIIDKRMELVGLKAPEAKTLILNQLNINAGFDESFFQKHGGFSKESRARFKELDDKIRSLSSGFNGDAEQSVSNREGEE